MGYLRFGTGLVGVVGMAMIIAAAATSAADDPGQVKPTEQPGIRLAPQAAGDPLLNTANHRLAEGDYLLAQFYDGSEQSEYRLQVDSAGEVRMPLIDAVNVANLLPREAAALLTEKYRKYYRQPYVSLQVLSLGQYDIFVFGPDIPGRIITLDNGTNFLGLLTGLGLEDAALYRRIHVLRGDFDFTSPAPELKPLLASPAGGGGLIALPSPSAVARQHDSLAGMLNWRDWVEERLRDPACQSWVLDPLAITVEGELSRNNIVLQPNDVLYIPTAERFVDISGVAKPGRYELLPDDDLGTILRLAGSLNYRADLENTVIRRLDADGRTDRLIFNLYPALDEPSQIEGFKLANRDIINIVNREERIFVLGEVNAAGAFGFIEDATVLDYLAEAGGETVEANLAWIAVIRQGRDRLNPLSAADVFQANFKEIQKGLPLCDDISLLPGDVIYVPPKGAKFELPQIIQSVSTAVTGFAVMKNSQKSD